MIKSNAVFVGSVESESKFIGSVTVESIFLGSVTSVAKFPFDASPSSYWILRTGFWDNTGVWGDFNNWID